MPVTLFDREAYIDELAPRLYKWSSAKRKTQPEPLRSIYYMSNVFHPMIISRYNQFRRDLGIKGQEPPSDNDRTRFELSLLSDQLLIDFKEFLDEQDRNQDQDTEKAL